METPKFYDLLHSCLSEGIEVQFITGYNEFLGNHIQIRMQKPSLGKHVRIEQVVTFEKLIYLRDEEYEFTRILDRMKGMLANRENNERV